MIFPLAIPLIAGPSAMATVLLSPSVTAAILEQMLADPAIDALWPQSMPDIKGAVALLKEAQINLLDSLTSSRS